MTKPTTEDRASQPVHQEAGGVPARAKTENSPHASEVSSAVRVAAILGGVTDAEGRRTPEELDATEAALDRIRTRPPAPIAVQSPEGKICAPHDDQPAGNARMLDVFGTRSQFFFVRQYNDLMAIVCRSPSEFADPDNIAVNAALAMVAAVEPENEIEAALAVQMAGVHSLVCDMTARAGRAQTPDAMSTYVNAATKLQRTFTSQIETLARLRGKGQQTVRVEHVNVQPGAQAIVGDVHHYPPQPSLESPTDARAPQLEQRPPLSSPNPRRSSVPRSGHVERPLPNARRGQHRGAPRDPKRAQARVLHPGSDRGTSPDAPIDTGSPSDAGAAVIGVADQPDDVDRDKGDRR